MRTLKFTKLDNGRVELIMKLNNGYFGIYFPVKNKEEYYEIVPIKSAQELINES